MKSILRFLLFVSILVAAVAVLYIWRNGKVTPSEAEPKLPGLAALD